jgi:mRNA interferase RelE/StbE
MANQPYLLKVTEDTAKLIRGLHPSIKSRIKSALKTLITKPYIGKALKDNLQGLRSYRIKRYRIIYRILSSKKQIEIIAVGPRKNIYEETFQLIQKKQKNQ